jgi:hypothetical protein
MRTSLTEIKQTEAWLQGKLAPAEALLFEARQLTNPLLRLQVALQQQAIKLAGLYHRQKLQEEVEGVHQRLFSSPDKRSFQQQIQQLFPPNQP